MTIYTPDELDLFDLTWVAVDRNDEIAVFWTAGKGAIAQLEIQTKERLELALDVLDNMLPTTEATAEDRSFRFDFRTQAAASPVELDTARQGLYVYDLLDQHRGQIPPDPHLYVRLARPMRPITVGEVRAELASFLVGLKSERIEFCSTEVVDVRDLERHLLTATVPHAEV